MCIALRFWFLFGSRAGKLFRVAGLIVRENFMCLKKCSWGILAEACIDILSKLDFSVCMFLFFIFGPF